MITHRWRLALALFGAAVGLGAPACSGSRDDLPRQPVAGTVTLDSQPLAAGTIQFAPAAGSGEAATSATVAIENGRFTVPRADGLVPGSYKVSISELNRKLEGRLKDTFKKRVAPVKELIPKKYNTQTTLTAEIKSGGASDLKFDLLSK